MRFLGRKVYVGFVVFLAVLRGLLGQGTEGADDAIGRVPRRTVRRWAGWWSRSFADHSFWRAESGRFGEPVARERLPESLLERFRDLRHYAVAVDDALRRPDSDDLDLPF